MLKRIPVWAASAALACGWMGTAAVNPVHALDNDLVRTPPMGWNSWNQVRCNGLTEDVVKRAADAMAERGLAKAGYQYVVVDDCWQGGRNEDGQLFADHTRFPSGMKALADYVHEKGLKFGIYSVPGSKTCANKWDHYPITGLGSLGHEAQDAQTFAKWGVDYLKYDWCEADVNDHLNRPEAFAKMRDQLAKTGRPIAYGISEYGVTKPWTWAKPIANLWRTTQDIQPRWDSIVRIIDSQAPLAGTSAPGGFNDPDMLQIGNGSLTDAENRSHFAMWSMLAAPLFMGTDLSALPQTTLETVTNPRLIAIDQDALGVQARRVTQKGGVEVWARPLNGGDVAVAVLNKSGKTATASVSIPQVTGQDSKWWVVTDQWTGRGVQNVRDTLPVTVDSHDTAVFRLHAGTDSSLPGLLGAQGVAFVTVSRQQTVPLTVTNASDVDLTDVSFSVQGGNNIIIQGQSATLAKLPAGKSATVNLSLTVSADAALGVRTLPVRVAADGGQATQVGTLTLTVVPAAPAEDVAASALKPVGYSVGWGQLRVNRSVDGNPLTVAGKVYERGFGAHATSTIDLWLGGQCQKLKGALGIDDETHGGSAQT